MQNINPYKLQFKQQTLKAVRHKFHKNNAKWNECIKAKVERYPKKSKAVIRQLENVLPNSIKQPACNWPLRNILATLLEAAFWVKLRELRKSGEIAYMVTIIPRDFITYDRRTEIHLTPIRRKIKYSLDKLGGYYFGMIEIQVCNNVRKNENGINHGHEICTHWHGVVITSKEFNPSTFAKELSKAYKNAGNDIQAVKIEEIGKTRLDFAYVANYITKCPYDQKSLYVKKGHPEKRNMRKAKDSRREILTLRLAEILSEFQIEDLIMASGDFRPMKRDVLRALKAHHAVGRENTDFDLSQDVIHKAWEDGKAKVGDDRFLSPITSTKVPPKPKPEPLKGTLLYPEDMLEMFENW